jgi:hypothetical protein
MGLYSHMILEYIEIRIRCQITQKSYEIKKKGSVLPQPTPVSFPFLRESIEEHSVYVSHLLLSSFKS